MTIRPAEHPQRPHYHPKSWARRHLTPQKAALIDQFLLLGWSTPAVALVTSSAYKTVRAQRDLIVSRTGCQVYCPCGLPSNHRGTCPDRLRIAEQARYIRMGLSPLPAPEPAPEPPKPVQVLPPAPVAVPEPKPDPYRFASDCPGGFCKMHVVFAELVGNYVIEYWMCSCNQERERRLVV